MKDEKVYNVVLTGIMMCLVMVATMTIRIPVPFTQGYVHLGDTMIFLAVLVLGKRNATLAAGFGSGLADLLSGYAYYAPWTLAVKALMAFVVGAALEHMEKKGQLEEGHVSLPVLLAMFFGGLEMTVGYYVAASLMHGNWYTPLFSVPGNIGQFAVGMVLAFILAKALYKTPARKYFAIK
ncbi:MAG: ECF transporter S component [Firmicutes bacterium]|nr:ECF transporter S component [Bacillota bacterium]